MKKTIYSKISDLLSEPQKYKLFKQFNDETTEAQIEAIQFFKNDIKPWWEDPSNQLGGEIQFDIPIQFRNIYNLIYYDLLLAIIGQNSEELRNINGLRVVDKINAKGGNRIRIELWLDLNPKEKVEQVKKIEEWIATLAEKYQLEKIVFTEIPHKN